MKNRKRSRDFTPKRSAPPPRIRDHSASHPEPATEPDPVPAQLARIDQISMIARTTWFGLLAYLAFVGITLLGVEDADFFVPSRQTQLPLVNVAIPTSAFFWFAPVLGAALYAYLHLQLLKLWEALAAPGPKPGGRHLSDVIYPWLISDYAIALRPDGAARHRPLAYLSYTVTWLLVWAAGPLVLTGFWWRSMPKHDEGLTLGIAVALLVTLYIGLTSRWQACNLLWQTQKKSPWQGWFRRPMFMLLCSAVIATSWLRTEGGIDDYAFRAINLVNSTFRTFYFRDCFNRDANRHIIDRMEECNYPNGDEKDLDTVQRERIARLPFIWNLDDVTFDGQTPLIGGWIGDYDTWTTLAPTNLAGVALVPNPGDLLDHTTERRRFRKTWCGRQGMDTETCGRLYTAAEPAPSYLGQRREAWCGDREIAPGENCTTHFKALDDEFRQEWKQLWTSRTAALGKLDLSGVDLRRADLNGAFLIGVDLTNARMERANLREARMEGADLRWARMERAGLSGARMEGADLRWARMEGADLRRARMEGANFHSADLKSAALTETFADTSVRAADLRSDDVTQQMLNNVFGDVATKIPGGLVMPDHWDTETLSRRQILGRDDPKFEAWLAERKAAKNGQTTTSGD